MKRNALLIFVLSIAALSGWGQTLRFVSILPSTTASGSYTPDGGLALANKYYFRSSLSSIPLANIFYFYTISGTRTLVNGSNSLSIGFFKPGTDEEILAGNGSGLTAKDVLGGAYLTGTATTTNDDYVDIRVYPGQIAPALTYTRSFTVSLYLGLPGTPGTFIRNRTLTVRATVASQVQISIGPSGQGYQPNISSHNVDLGEVSAGASRDFSVYLLANRGYKLTMTVASGGRLHSGTTSDLIPYTLKLNGNSLTPGTGVVIDQTSTAAVYKKEYIFTVVVPAGADVEAGTYTDTISFSISAL